MATSQRKFESTDAVKTWLFDAIVDVIEARKWNQQQAAAILGTTQARVSELRRRRYRQFSLNRLLDYAARVNIDVTITMTDQ